MAHYISYHNVHDAPVQRYQIRWFYHVISRTILIPLEHLKNQRYVTVLDSYVMSMYSGRVFLPQRHAKTSQKAQRHVRMLQRNTKTLKMLATWHNRMRDTLFKRQLPLPVDCRTAYPSMPPFRIISLAVSSSRVSSKIGLTVGILKFPYGSRK